MGFCWCDGSPVSQPLTSPEQDELGHTIEIDRCPLHGLSAKKLELLEQAMIFHNHHVLPLSGGQINQPLRFFEVVDGIQGFLDRERARQEKLQKARHGY